MIRQLLSVVLVLSVVTSVYGAKAAPRSRSVKSSKYDRSRKPRSSSKTPPAAKAPARYNPAVERIKFFTAAGKDSELDGGEFNSNRAKSNGFVRKTDSWSTMLRYDRDGNKTIDWFEADSYRRSQYKVTTVQVTLLGGGPMAGGGSYARMSKEQIWGTLTKKYDKNGDGKLEGEEKSHAYREYKQIREQQEREERARREREKSSQGSSRRSNDDIKAELLKRFDWNRDGKLEGKEREAAVREYKRIRHEEGKR